MSYGFYKTLSTNKGNSRFSRVIFYDVESKLIHEPNNVIKFSPFLVTAIFANYNKQRDKWYSKKIATTSIKEFWDFVEDNVKNKSKILLVSHHLEVDFIPMDGFNQLKARGWTLDKLINHDRVSLLYYHKDTKKLVVVNNGNIFDGSIEQWGKILGIQKLTMPDENDDLEKWKVYCMRDTEIVFEMWKYLYKFMDENNLGNMKLTKAGLAFNAFRHRFMTRPIVLHRHKESIALEKESYHGGRFEALKIGIFDNDTYYKLDINSMYAAIQVNYDLPRQLAGYCTNREPGYLAIKLHNFAVIADVELNVTEPVFPIYDNRKIKYLTGKIRTVLSTPELQYALEHKWIKKVYRMSWYYKDFILRDFAQYFTELKIKYSKEDNKAMRALAKIYPNAVYGKFAQKGYKDEIVGDCDPDIFQICDSYILEEGKKVRYLYYGGKIHKESVEDISDNGFVAIASHITAYGRIWLWKLVKIAGIDNVYHLATDSLIVNSQGYKNLSYMLDDYQLGKMKIEDKANYIEIRDTNDYRMGENEKIKGVGHKAEQVSANSFKVTYWTSLKSIIKSNNTSEYFVRIVTKTLSRDKYKYYLARYGTGTNT